ncbi:hypothetical protein LTR62_008314 [Meristemomyces frigidus]|uniref:Chromo domain-containing protein n=1 Tax=Meristemomyces frigidus TaxID=1508187 RepID=A0AAN7YCW1_9PEZI|nr:hypothetical protein LTR62_008314 [Meristemomyces frigidus]
MPPAISDVESDDDMNVPDMIPAKGKASVIEPEPAEEEEEVEEDGSADDEDAFAVERILSHDYAKDGSVIYEIKWLGYDEDKDLTWEPLENLDAAPDILAAYHKKIGGAPEPRSKSAKKGKGKRTASQALESPAPASTKRGRKSNGVEAAATESKRTLPLGSWDDDVLVVSSIVEEESESKTGSAKQKKQLIGLLEWKKPGPKTQHKMKVLRQKVPQRLLDYYEQHLVFTRTDDDDDEAAEEEEATNGGAMNVN